VLGQLEGYCRRGDGRYWAQYLIRMLCVLILSSNAVRAARHKKKGVFRAETDAARRWSTAKPQAAIALAREAIASAGAWRLAFPASPFAADLALFLRAFTLDTEVHAV
jgi:hypothetical protein